MFTPLILLTIALLILLPLAQHQRERALSERLKRTRDPHEAMLAIDDAMRRSQRQSRWMENLRASYKFWLR